jgi:hypothetical protein
MKNIIPNLDSYINEQFLTEALVGTFGGVSLYINVLNLKIYKPWCRGFILKNGDFYLMDSTIGFVTHDTGLKIAYSQGILKHSPFKWEQEKPWEFLCVQRFNNTGEFYVS